MKAIKDLDLLISRLENENAEWQKSIYDAIGVILTKDLNLCSKCGTIALDSEMEFCYENGVDSTEYCEVNSDDEMISYIKNMDGYVDVLVDKSFGEFTKSEFYWAIQQRVLEQKSNWNEAGVQDWGFYAITEYNNCMEVQGALIPCAPVDIWVDIDYSTSLDEALEKFVSELNRETEYKDWLMPQKVYPVDVIVPNTYEMLKEQINK